MEKRWENELVVQGNAEKLEVETEGTKQQKTTRKMHPPETPQILTHSYDCTTLWA